MRKVLVLTAAGACVLTLGLTTTPANAAAAGTALTVNLSGGSLSISAPGTASLTGSATTGSTLTGPLGSTPTQITDSTGSLLGWSDHVTVSSDLTSTGTPADKISLAVGSSTLTIVAGTVAASGTSLLTGVAAGGLGTLTTTTSVPLVTAVAGAGGGTYSFTPTLALVVPPNTKAHTDYTTTITQTVS